MAKGQKGLQQQATQRSNEQYETGAAAQRRLVEGSPEFQAYQARAQARRKTIEDGTFADSKEFLSNRDSVAARAAQRQGEMEMANTGFGALGARYADANQLALTDKIMKDEFGRDSAMQAEQDKRQFVSETAAMENDVVGKKLGVDTTLMGTGFSQANINLDRAAQIAAARASVLPGIIGMGIQGAASAFGPGFGLAAFGKKGGARSHEGAHANGGF